MLRYVIASVVAVCAVAAVLYQRSRKKTFDVPDNIDADNKTVLELFTAPDRTDSNSD